jgi:hypothetical protein
MIKSRIAWLVVLAATQVAAAGFGLKPGLWESRVVKQVMDGRDMTAQIAGAASQMQQAMANLPPEQRARMDVMMKSQGGMSMGSNGTFKMCITAEEANRDRPIIDRQGTGHCEPSSVTHSGNHSTFTISCSSNGNVTTGKGESTASGDLISSQVDITVHRADGSTHQTHTETEMKFLGADCGDVKPMSMPSPAPDTAH